MSAESPVDFLTSLRAKLATDDFYADAVRRIVVELRSPRLHPEDFGDTVHTRSVWLAEQVNNIEDGTYGIARDDVEQVVYDHLVMSVRLAPAQ